MYKDRISNHIESIKLKALSNFILLLILAVSLLLIITIINPFIFPIQEIKPTHMIKLTSAALISFIISFVCAKKKYFNLSIWIFLSTIYISSIYAITSNNHEIQIQNSFGILMSAVLIATFFLTKKQSYMTSTIVFLTADLLIFKYNINIKNFIPGFIFFHIFIFVSFWIATVKEQIEELLIQRAQNDAKLKQIGFISSSIAHEINNPLSIINGCIQTLHGKLTHKDMNQIFTMAFSNIKRIENIVKSMYGLIETNTEMNLPIVLLETLDKEIQLAIDSFRQHHQIKIEYINEFEENIYLNVNIGEVIQILTNLLRNSYQSVSSSNEALIQIHLYTVEKEIILDVKDSGAGVPKHIAKNLGENFNTGSLKGLGLGLSISLFLANKNNSSLEYLQDQKPTTFRLRTPTNVLSSCIKESEILQIKQTRKANLIKLKNNIILILMQKGQLTISQADIVQNIQDQQKLISNQYHYIVITEDSKITMKALLYFRSKNVKNLFLSGAIIGQSKSARLSFNFFTKILKLKYPIKLFGNIQDALEWTLKNKSI